MSFFKSYLKIINHPSNQEKKIYATGKLLWWKFNQLFFKFPILITFKDNIKIICYPNSSYGSLIFYTLYPEFYEMKVLEFFLKKNSIFLDIGAGFGDYSLLAGSIIKKGKIYAFEPLAEERERFSQNIKINNLNKLIKVYSSAVSNSLGSVTFSIEKTKELSHITSEKSSHQKNVSKIRTTTIDHFLTKNKIKEIDAIKIDVEGAELLVLEGAKKSLEKGIVKLMIVEFNSNQENFEQQRTNNLNYFTYLKKCGYQVFTINNGYLKKISSFNKKTTQNLLIIKKNKKIISQIRKILSQLPKNSE